MSAVLSHSHEYKAQVLMQFSKIDQLVVHWVQFLKRETSLMSADRHIFGMDSFSAH